MTTTNIVVDSKKAVTDTMQKQYPHVRFTLSIDQCQGEYWIELKVFDFLFTDTLEKHLNKVSKLPVYVDDVESTKLKTQINDRCKQQGCRELTRVTGWNGQPIYETYHHGIDYNTARIEILTEQINATMKELVHEASDRNTVLERRLTIRKTLTQLRQAKRKLAEQPYEYIS
ncbi:hypothetical protein [Paenibacillus vini]|uniref:Uncharacterized protein n=1 Tax=Paenibacillus vini TaxID=1476024 RepID=A0ABQ4M748_9BACL|nr:hypothetical protein [Paenibacillus vini]GIP51816.1 hypothetical protein J42TS3_08510 [Paenibacillus vini]